MTATSAEVANVWLTEVLNDARIQAITTQVHNRRVFDTQDSQCDLAQIMHCSQIHFIQFFVQRRREFENRSIAGWGCEEMKYRVQIEYFLESSCDNTEVDIQSFFELLDTIIIEKLGDTWLNCVSRYFGEDNFPSISKLIIEGKDILVGRYTYFAESN